MNTAQANIRSGGNKLLPDCHHGTGARLPVTGYQSGWYQVGLYNGAIGWISENIVRLDAHDTTRPIQPIIGFYTLAEGPGLPVPMPLLLKMCLAVITGSVHVSNQQEQPNPNR